MKKKVTFTAVMAEQSKDHKVLSFAATPDEINSIAEIDRIGRDGHGRLSGFQRPQIAAHIREIKDYLEKPDAILPNPIVVAFTHGVTVTAIDDSVVKVSIDVSQGPIGLVVDGQQRLSALTQIKSRPFKVFVSLILCADDAELRRQFVLINNTRPLPKSLIYELLPGVDKLPPRFESRSVASELTDKLNYSTQSSLRGQIRQHTNPTGLINDTAIQRVIMNSLNDGIMRDFMREPNGIDRCQKLVSEFYDAVKKVFPEDWWGHTSKSSRLVHGAGIVALGYVMEVLAVLEGARNWEEFAKGMGCLAGRTAWTSGHWDFGGGDVRHWRAIQNVSKDISTLAQHLVQIVRHDIKLRRSRPQVLPLFERETV
ncbi:DGQHR domain-containing protein DpdB [Prosthecomicrobium sp. N25]|uniref:DGQHR domain-containing protein DpdB n=1 Tax=Prosthecomicrobium sp. N25 TaxID=3129254 RepID=UPI0030788BD4